MKPAMQPKYPWFLALVIVIGFASVTCRAQAASKPSSTTILRDGTPIPLTLKRTVSSESDQPGELVEFVLKQNLIVDSVVLLPEGTSAWGKVTAARLVDRATGRPGMLEFRLEFLKLPNGQEIPLRTVPELPSDPNQEIDPAMFVNLVNSPYAPFQHLTKEPITTVPKEMPLTLYVAADVNISDGPVALHYTGSEQADTISAHISHSGNGKSLGEIAREQRERGRIGTGMVSASQ
jgi:hypothetical protein